MNRRNIAPWKPIGLAFAAAALVVAAVVVTAAGVFTSPNDEADPTADLLHLSFTPTPKDSPRVILPQRTQQSVNGRDPMVFQTPAPTPTPAPTAVPVTPPPPPREPAAVSVPTDPPPPPPTPTPIPGEYRPDLSDELYGLLNQQRTQAGLSPVVRHETLAASATAYAQLLWLNDPYELDHWLDGGPGDRAWTRGYCCGVGEILVESEGSAASMVDLWMNSAPHRSVIMDPQYVSLGVACYDGAYVGDDGNVHHPIVCVGDFGSG